MLLICSQIVDVLTDFQAGEAIGKWQSEQPIKDEASIDGSTQLPNALELPFRRQPAPGKNTLVEITVYCPFIYSHIFLLTCFINYQTSNHERLKQNT